MSIIDIVIAVAAVAIVGGSVFLAIRRRKNKASGCGGGCAGCSMPCAGKE